MKKHFAFLTATLLAVSLSACSTPNTSTGGNTSSASDITTSSSVIESSSSDEVTSSSSINSVSSSSSSISSSSSSSSTSSVETPKDVKIGEVYTSNYWDLTIKNMTKTVLGDLWEKVPEFTATRYEAVMGYAEQNAPLTIQIKCYGANASSAVRLYKERMEAYGYYFSAESSYGYQMVDYYSDLFLAYSLVTENTEVPYFVIQSNIQQTREKEWNAPIVSLYTDTDDIPACPGMSYQTTYDNSKDTLSVFALFVDKNTVVSKYINELYKVGFTVKNTDQYGATTLIDNTGYLTVQLYLTYGDYDCDALYINFVNAWPSIGIASFTNLTKFPRLVSDTAKYDFYTYLNLGSEDLPDYKLCIYYINASSTDYEGYVDTLVTYGFTKGNVEVSETNIISTYLNIKYPYQEEQKTGTLTLDVRVLYQISSNTVCIVIEQAGLLLS